MNRLELAVVDLYLAYVYLLHPPAASMYKSSRVFLCSSNERDACQTLLCTLLCCNQLWQWHDMLFAGLGSIPLPHIPVGGSLQRLRRKRDEEQWSRDEPKLVTRSFANLEDVLVSHIFHQVQVATSMSHTVSYRA